MLLPNITLPYTKATVGIMVSTTLKCDFVYVFICHVFSITKLALILILRDTKISTEICKQTAHIP